MEEDKIKDAFLKVKQDIDFLNSSIFELKNEISRLNNLLNEDNSIQKNTPYSSTDNLSQQTNRQHFDTSSTHIPTQNSHFKALKPQIYPISTGNEGVPTDRQTNQQTDRHIENTSINDAAEMLNSLDNVKKELRLRFKRLTDQEIRIFSTIYQFDEEFGFSDYRVIAEKLSLTESSIRDYVGRLIKKGVPIEKKKVNNKAIKLSISENLKKIAPLSTILQLRDL